MKNNYMKKWFWALLALIILILSEQCLAVENSSVRSPIASGTVPPSSVSRGLVPTPNPIDSSSNLVITGNVTGGKHFRGPIPYNSPTSFESQLGSSSLDSFLRYSTPDTLSGPGDLDHRSWISAGSSYSSIPGQYRSFFSPSGTVATTEAGRQISMNNLADSKRSIAVDGGLALPVMSRTPQEMERLIYDELGTNLPQIVNPRQLRREPTTTEQYQLPSISNITDDTGRMQNISVGTTAGTINTGQRTEQGWSSGIKGFESNVGMYPSNIKDIDRLIAQIETRVKTQDSSLADAGTATGFDDIRTGRAGFRPPSISQEELVEQAQPYNARDKFNWYMQAAQLYLKQGRYYRAADSYTMASIYKPDVPSGGLAYAGKSHALFAAGEYMTSALFLSRAIEVLPEYARLKVDLVGIFGDQDTFAYRVADVEERFKISGAAELQFLLGYVYYQSFLRDGTVRGELDRLDAAKRLIDSASRKLPGSKAVEMLKNVVGETINRK